MDPSQQQLAARLNPTAVTINVPADQGLFRAVGDFGTTLYRIDPASGKVVVYDLLNTLGGGAKNGNAGGQAQAALSALKDQYGIDYNSLPAVNIGDLTSALARKGIGYNNSDGSYVGWTTPGNFNDIRNFTPAKTQTQDINTQPNTVASPDQLAAAKAATDQQLGQSTPAAAAPEQPNTASNTPPTTASSLQPPTGNLQPGMTGDAVKQLQDYLVSKGYMTQAQVNTGYGTYGPQTTAAVQKLQQDLGVDNSSGPGFWGPKTIAVATGQTTSQTTPTAAAENPLAYNENYGVSQDQWNQMNDTQKAVISAVYTAKQAAYQTDGQQMTFADALTQAAQDPNIIAKYADAAKLDATQFAQNLQQIQQTSTDNAQTYQQQFENDRRALAEQQAAKGTAYSGFRNQAQENLGKTENGIVQSSRASLQKQLNDATQSFEERYGTSATTPASALFNDPNALSKYSLSGLLQSAQNGAQTLTGALAGGITGSLPIQKNNDINTKATDLYKTVNYVPQTS